MRIGRYIRLYLYANLYINGAKFDHVFWYYTYAMFRSFFEYAKTISARRLESK